MAQKPSTHRQSENTHGDAGSAGEPAQLRCGKAMPHHQSNQNIEQNIKEKPNIALLHFGLDYLVLLVGIDQKNAASLRLLSAVFNLPHNDTNADEHRNFVWADTDEEVTFRFSKYQHDEVVYVYRGEDHLFSIQKIGKNSTMPPSVKKKYWYRISFYSWFFGLARLGEIDVHDYWGIFLRDIESGFIVHSVSRIDICADLGNISVSRVQRGIVRLSERSKKLSKLNIDPVTLEPETVYFGERSNHWKARIYNKLVEAERKGKERLYPEYWFCDFVTRLEVELHSRSCQTYSINLKSVMSLEHLLMVFRAHLKNKAASWRILRFIEEKLKERGYKALPPQREKFEYDQISESKFFKATFRKTLACAKRYGIDINTILSWIREMVEDSPQSYV
ncbi:MAG: phage/plasmid replication protein [Candidatus Peribacteraceae bacterium]|nr:phage/plasmid replication protein [Candidatus Peribacteraceae bacterium]